MGKTYKDKRRYFRYAAIALLVVFLLSGGLLLLDIWDRGHGSFQGSGYGDGTVRYNGAEYLPNENIETFLVLGLDKFDGEDDPDAYNNNQQADFLALFIFDNSAKKYSILHINRDTMTSVNSLGVSGQTVGTEIKQIALAHTYGNGKEVSCRNTSDALSALLNDVRINHYMSFTMDSVAIVNDMVGGVEVEVLHDFTGVDDSLVKGEKVVLKGQQALTYVRSRQGVDDGTNISRMERQRQYMNGLYTKTVESIENDENFVVDLMLKMTDYMVSDRSVSDFEVLADKLTTYEFTGTITVEGESKAGDRFMEFYPDYDKLDKLVIDLFYTPKNQTEQ